MTRLLSIVPFVSFIILAGNAIATSSSADLDLLSSVLSVISPIVETSPLARRMHGACERFFQIAGVIVSAATTSRDSITIRLSDTTPSEVQTGHEEGKFQEQSALTGDGEQAFGFPMALEDWDSVMLGYESELGNGSFDARTLTGIIEPYITNPGW